MKTNSLQQLSIALVILSVQLFFQVSCVSKKKYNELDAKTDSLQVVTVAQNRQLRDIQEYIEMITMSLDSIAYQEQLLYLPDRENGGRVASRSAMISRLETFEKLIARQKEKVQNLEGTIARDSLRLSGLSKLVTHLTAQIEQKDAEIESLKKELSQNNIELVRTRKKVRELNENVDNLSNTVEDLNKVLDDLNGSNEVLQKKVKQSERIYYIIGTRKELKDKGILVANSITPKINISNLSLSLFTSALPEDLEMLTFPGRTPRIITNMPQGSYRLFDGKSSKQSRLEVIDQEAFWSITKILVILVN